MPRSFAINRTVAANRSLATVARGLASGRALVAQGPDGTGLLAGLVAYWKLEESSGARVDATGRGNDLSSDNGVGQAAGIIDKGASFDADSAQKLVGGTDGDYSFAGGPFSVSCWVKLANGATQVIWSKYHYTAEEVSLGPQLYLDGATGSLTFYIEDYTGNVDVMGMVAVPDIEPGTWYHLVATFDGQNLMLYLNGELAAYGPWMGAYPIENYPSTFLLGDNGDGYPMSGVIDEVGKWNVALSAEQARQLYNAGQGLPFENFS